MKKVIFILFLSITYFDLASQNYKEINSIRLELQIIQSEPAYIFHINYLTKTDSIVFVTDTIYLNDKANLTKYNYSHIINDNTIIKKTKYFNFGLHYSKTDSISLYFPLELDKNSMNPTWHDTLEAVTFSEILTNLKEPLIFNNKNKINILRLTTDLIHHYKTLRIEVHNDSATLYIKETHCQSQSLVEDSEIICINSYNKIIKQLRRTVENFDKDPTIIGNNILIEYLIDGKYEFIKINSYNIHWNNPECKNIRKLLEMLSELE